MTGPLRYKVTDFKGWRLITQEFIKNNPVNKESDSPDEKHLLLDLDDCLISSSYSKDSFNVQGVDLMYRRWERPGLAHFLEQVSKSFKVSVFTSAHEIYARNVVLNLSVLSKRNIAIYTRDHLEFNGDSICKPLDIVYKLHKSKNGENEKKALKNVLLLDNDPFYVAEGYRFNVLVAEEFKSGDQGDVINDGEPLLHAYLPVLEYLSKCEDISATMKRLHEEWEKAGVIKYITDPLSSPPRFNL